MNKAYQIKNGLKKVGKRVCLVDGDWQSAPFYAVVEQKWRSNKSNFEFSETEIGRVSVDYFTYIGPFDHDIEAVSENGYLCSGSEKYIFKKKEKVDVGGTVQYFWAILRRVWEDEND